MNCLFCSIAQKEIKSMVVYEDNDTLAFLDIHPRAVGHTMVIPKKHSETTLDLPEDGYGPIMKAMVETEKKLSEALRPDGFTIGINQKKAAGQEIDHLHVHIIPRYLNDGGGSLQSVVSEPPEESVEEIFKKISAPKGNV